MKLMSLGYMQIENIVKLGSNDSLRSLVAQHWMHIRISYRLLLLIHLKTRR
jgi:hypothetical protein